MRRRQNELPKRGSTPRGNDDRCDAANGREDDAFNEELCCEANARDAEREADGDFVTSLVCANEKEVRNVRAGDQEYNRRDAGDAESDGVLFWVVAWSECCDDRTGND